MRIYNIVSTENEAKYSTYDPYSETAFGQINFCIADGTVIEADTADRTADGISVTHSNGFGKFYSLTRNQFIDFAEILDQIWDKEEAEIDIPSWLEAII